MDRDKNRLELVRQYWVDCESILLKRAIKIMGDEQEARELLQQAAVIAVEQFDSNKISSSSEFARWMWTRCKWLGLDRISQLKRWVDLPELVSNDTPVEYLSGKELWAKLLDQLPKSQKQIAILKIQGFSATEIAKTLGKKSASVRSNWRHAKVTMLIALEEYFNE
ncbi:sigma-70 family RNA polymerase sigma factor [Aliikangiella marina]|uniref:Sigma-70 family RNA polymerase sigma factor n=1 Tax=Aliikangiella marina TaxID=1712262 RepID=A0A545T6E9_9GAMM|nr:sigma-70 family RNA polymerase sigma factor [Aliikangiella marina]TQV72755.1 sigma-70 family RNA polymerase sigma factor [Aliikangiella marina]